MVEDAVLVVGAEVVAVLVTVDDGAFVVGDESVAVIPLTVEDTTAVVPCTSVVSTPLPEEDAAAVVCGAAAVDPPVVDEPDGACGALLAADVATGPAEDAVEAVVGVVAGTVLCGTACDAAVCWVGLLGVPEDVTEVLEEDAGGVLVEGAAAVLVGADAAEADADCWTCGSPASRRGVEAELTGATGSFEGVAALVVDGAEAGAGLIALGWTALAGASPSMAVWLAAAPVRAVAWTCGAVPAVLWDAALRSAATAALPPCFIAGPGTTLACVSVPA